MTESLKIVGLAKREMPDDLIIGGMWILGEAISIVFVKIMNVISEIDCCIGLNFCLGRVVNWFVNHSGLDFYLDRVAHWYCFLVCILV